MKTSLNAIRRKPLRRSSVLYKLNAIPDRRARSSGCVGERSLQLTTPRLHFSPEIVLVTRLTCLEFTASMEVAA